MRKHDSFRAALVAAFPELGRNPQSLAVWIEKGRIAARGGPAGAGRITGFEWRYTLTAALQDFDGDTNRLAAVVLEWIRLHQPETLLNHGRGDESFSFEVDVLDETKVDIVLTIDLDEAVDVAADGTATYRAEPAVEEGYADVPAGTALERILVSGEALFGAPEP
ncbi:MAG TPA: phage tail protein [Croceibacterium sp.]|nr:phage tail protein [Croceibacterium sp.]